MKLGKYHVEIDEIKYDREELEDLYNQHKHNIMQFGDYMQYLTPTKREFKGRKGMNAVAVQKTEGKDLLEYPQVKKYVDMFNWKQYPGPRDVDFLHYDVGYKFHPHTDHYMNMVGLSTYGNFYTNRISGGIRQRVAIAQTLASSPDILLMDEPFGALDAQTREHLQFQLMEINKSEKKTTIFVTHDVEEAILLADRVVIFSARPARVVQEIDVNAVIPVDDRRDRTADMQKFFSLRNEILEIIRAEYQKTMEAT